MKKFSNMTFKVAVVFQILALTLLAACSSTGSVSGAPTSSTVCHATGDASNPYEEINVNSAELQEHSGHPEDFNPAPMGGCPTDPVVISDGKITICHATSSKKNPYNEITVSVNGLNGHDKHTGDIIPAPASGCPTTKP